MARIDIGAPYQKYLQDQVDAGYYRSITAAAEAAILKKMQEEEQLRLASIRAVLAKGEEAIERSETVIYKRGLMKEISLKGKERSQHNPTYKKDVTP